VSKRVEAAALIIATKIRDDDKDDNEDNDDKMATLGPMARDEDEDEGKAKAEEEEVK
jgi:hypothetical protein